MTEAAQLTGAFIAAGIGAAGMFIVASELHWCAYGRATLFWFATYQWFFAMTRLFGALDIVSRETQYTINTLGSAAFLALMLNLIVIHWMWHRTAISKKGENNGTDLRTTHG